MEKIRDSSHILTPEFSRRLEEWYIEATDKNTDFLVFITRRSFILASTIGKLTKNPLEDLEISHVLTDSALFLYADEIAEKYVESRKYPRIRIIDDMLVHGRNANSILSRFENEVYDRIKAKTIDEDILSRATIDLVNSIRLVILARSKENILLYSRYIPMVRHIMEVNSRQWHKISADITLFIAYQDIANASYVFSEKISEKGFESAVVRLDCEKDIIDIDYHGIRQKVIIKYIYRKNSKDIIGVATIRLQKHGAEYRVLPYVVMYDMSKSESSALVDRLLYKLSEKDNRYSKRWSEMIRTLAEIPTPDVHPTLNRNLGELITLILSLSVLSEFNRTFNLVPDGQDINKEISKLSFNYVNPIFYADNEHMSAHDTTMSAIKELISDPVIGSIDELTDVVNSCIIDANPICTDEGHYRPDMKAVMESVENYFYRKGRLDEYAAYVELNSREGSGTAGSKQRNMVTWARIISDFHSFHPDLELKYYIAYALILMDCGILSTNSIGQESDTIGYAQVAKAGECAMLVYPIREGIVEWLYMADAVYDYCYRNNLDFKVEHIEDNLRDYLEYDKIDPDMDEDKMNELILFFKNLIYMHQSPAEWLDDYSAWIFGRNLTEGWIDRVNKLKSEQEFHKERYVDFLKSRMHI